ncbi:MAG: acyl-CoA thioesterase [Desulfobulbaceae bacterium]|nr:MAG: acyl-CoA thioesterase [Desulfobulbaceae bacterium]
MNKADCQIIMSHMMLPNNANPNGNVHGGDIMKLIDDAAGVVAMKHARSTVVTASIDRLDFHRPVFIGNLLVLKASLNATGRTSMEIGVRVEAEDLKKGSVNHIASAYLTFVALDEDGKPTQVPSYQPQSEDDQRRHREAAERKRCYYKS